MIGAIAGDVIGSVFEFNNVLTTDFPLFNQRSRFTDDTVLTIAVADTILGNGGYSDRFKYYGRRYPKSGYGGRFKNWLFSDDSSPYNSFGNGSAMRVSPVGFAFDSLDEVLNNAGASAAATHNHPEGIKGAQAVAAAIFLARKGAQKKEIRAEIENLFGYSLSRSIAQIRPDYHFDETCQGSVPEALTAFFESASFEDAIRLAVSLGGDSDTLACIAGGIAQAYYGGAPEAILAEIHERLPREFVSIILSFEIRFGIQHGLNALLNSSVI